MGHDHGARDFAQQMRESDAELLRKGDDEEYAARRRTEDDARERERRLQQNRGTQSGDWGD